MKTMIILSISLLLSVISCDKNQDEINKKLQVEFDFQLLIDNGYPSTVFQEGQNFYFNFVISNKSSKNISYSPSFIDDNFFRVYRIDNSEGEVSMGKPYSSIFCEFSGGQFIIPSNDELRFEIPWIPSQDFCCPPFCKVNSNPPLPKGSYKTFIEGPFNFNIDGDAYTITRRFEIHFKIE